MASTNIPYFVYLLECADGTFYTGITTDVERRLAEHKNGIGSRYTRAHGAKKMLHVEKYLTRSEALRREVEIKRFSRVKKLKLAAMSTRRAKDWTVA